MNGWNLWNDYLIYLLNSTKIPWMDNILRWGVTLENWLPAIEDGAGLELLHFASCYNLVSPFAGSPNTTQTLYLRRQKLQLTFYKHLYHRSFHSQKKNENWNHVLLDRLQRPDHSSLVIFLFLRNITFNYFWIMWEKTVYIFYFKSNLRWSSLAQRQFKKLKGWNSLLYGIYWIELLAIRAVFKCSVQNCKSV